MCVRAERVYVQVRMWNWNVLYTSVFERILYSMYFSRREVKLLPYYWMEKRCNYL